MSNESGSDPDAVFAHAAGHLAREVSAEMVRPLRNLRETLAIAVEKLDRHMGQAKGPEPLPWSQLDRLRQQLADAYLQCRQLTRLASELADVTRDGAVRVEAIDVNKLVDHSLHLARHKIAAHTQVYVDHGAVPLVRGASRLVVLSVVAALAASAQSAAGGQGASVTIATRQPDDAVERVVIEVYDDGGGADTAAALACLIGAEAAEISAGEFSGASESARGCRFELRLPTGH